MDPSPAVIATGPTTLAVVALDPSGGAEPASSVWTVGVNGTSGRGRVFDA